MSFVTPAGIKVPAITVAQMREIDRLAVEETGPNLYQMMENAGRNLAGLVMEIIGENWRNSKIAVLAGNGNNGGGGICAGRHLANHGAKITVIAPSSKKEDTVRAEQLKIFQHTNSTIKTLGESPENSFDLIIDAIIGYGLKGAPKGESLDLINFSNQSNAKIISLDIPSGIDGDTGSSYGAFVKADITMTLALPKTGLKSPASGKLFLADIGIPEGTFIKAGIDYEIPFDHKYRVLLKRK